MGVYVRALTLVLDRIQAHVDGGLLRGWNFRRELASEVEGKASLPWLRLTGVVSHDTISPQEVVRPSIDIGVVLATDLKDGLQGALSAYETLCDALECRTDGTLDPAFGFFAAGVSFRFVNMFATPLAVHLNSIINLKLPRTLRGARRQ